MSKAPVDFWPQIRQNVDVRVISLKPLREFWGRHGDVEEPLRLWHKTATNAAWSSLRDVRRTYPRADGVRTSQGDTLTVFDIGGNRCRLVVRIRYDCHLIHLWAVLTLQEYDEGRWKD